MQSVEAVPRFSLYGEAERGPDLRFVHIESIPARSRPNCWRIAPHRHVDLCQLLLATAGGGNFQADIEIDAFEAPALIITPPSIIHGYSFTPDTDGWVLTIAGSYVAEILGENSDRELILDAVGPAVLTLDEEAMRLSRLRTWFASISREFHGGFPGRDAAIAAYLRLLLVAISRARHDRRFATISFGADQTIFRRFRALVERNYCNRRSIGEYAKEMAITEARLAIACRRIAGQAPHDVIHARVIVEAKRCLLYTSVTVAEIGFSLGFDDPAYFSRFFTHHAGMTPSAFRDRTAE